MKKYIAVLPCVVSCFTGFGQISVGFPAQSVNCLQPYIYTHPSFPGSYSVAREFSNATCVEFNENTIGNLIQEGKTDVVAGDAIHFTGTMHIGDFSAAPPVPVAGGGTVPAQFHAWIGNNDFEAAWFEPTSTVGQVGKYEKLELGLKLPTNLAHQIDRFVNDSLNPDKVNPFDPAQISFEADFYYLNNEFTALNKPIYKKVYGFYYEEYKVPLPSTEPNQARWVMDTSNFNVRFRFAPPLVGNWVVKLKIITPSQTIQALPINFECVPSSNDGYISTSTSNFRYLKKGNTTFFPIGTNLPHPTCYSCYAPGDDGYELYNNVGASPNAFTIYFNELKDLKNKGGNYFRMLMSPATYDVEFERLNNYSDRMNNAWEMDRLLDTLKVLDLYMHWDLQFHYTIENPSFYRMMFYDWTRHTLESIDPTHLLYPASEYVRHQADSGYCYNYQLGLTSPMDFFTDSLAVKHYKNKIRYMISRWGYSTNIGVIELFSEVDNSGTHTDFDVVPDPSHPGQYMMIQDLDSSYKPYWALGADGLANVEKIEAWNKELARYIKVDLQHTQHLISQSYTGGPSTGERKNEFDFGDDTVNISGADHIHDQTYEDPNIDFISWNNHKGTEIHRFEFLVNRDITFRWTQEDIYKPIFLAEIGTSSETNGFTTDYNYCDYNTEFIRSLWCTAFSGCAGAALDYNSKSHDSKNWWQNYGILGNFLQGNSFAINNWIPAYDKRNDNLAEVFALINTSTEDEAWGIVSNKTYNYYNYFEPETSCDTLPSPNPGDDYDNLTNLTPNLINGLKLDLEAGDYTIAWYNVLTGNLISTTGTTVPLFGKLKLDHPILCLHDCEDEDAEVQPIIAFKAFKTGSRMAEDIPKTLDPTKQVDFTVFPNPTSNQLTVETGTFGTMGQLKIVNSLGKTMYSNNLSETTLNLDVSKFETGVYFVILENKKNILTKKLIIQHD